MFLFLTRDRCSTHQELNESSSPKNACPCGQTPSPTLLLHSRTIADLQTHKENDSSGVSQTLPPSLAHINSHPAEARRAAEPGYTGGEGGGGGGAGGRTECSELLHSAATLHGSAIQTP